jgi:hypothetical protein
MSRSRYDQIISDRPGLAKVLHACAGCGKVGSRPGILDTRAGDYGLRDFAKKYGDLSLNAHGHCAECAAQFDTAKR